KMYNTSTMRKFCLRAVVVWMAALPLGMVVPRAMGQAETATVAGRVSDPTGAGIPNATLHLVDINSGIDTKAKTNGSGRYVIPSVAPGRYRMRAEHEGFKASDLVGLTVNVQDHIEENFSLEVGSAAESVTVTASGQNVNTADASVGTVIDREFVDHL